MNYAVEIDGLDVNRGGRPVLRGLSARLEAGRVTGLLGPSGCGKTTLLRIIGGLERATAGTVEVDGTRPDAARAEKRIGVVPQSPALLPWRTVEANARLLLDVNRRATRGGGPDPVGLLHEVGQGDFLGAYPRQLSGGMQQRVALVRAFALGAPLLLLDEPFAALDEITRADMRHLLAELCERHGTTVLFVTHSIAEAVFLSDRVVVLSRRPGQVVGIEAVDLPRPRRAELEDEPAFFEIETRLRHLLQRGSQA
jgi:NitT/TauT family transport system ATP-binding protein